MNTIVSVPVDATLSSFIGKRGADETSIVFYNRKIGEDIIVALTPSDPEGKFYGLPNSMLIAEQIVLSTAAIDKLFGEAVIAASLLPKRTIITNDGDADGIIKAAGFEKPEFAARGELLDKIIKGSASKREGSTRVDIDRAFNVKGVGTVLLGIVTRGTLRKHDKLYLGNGKEVQVRSIQCQDQDVDSADVYARVGIAAKGIDETDLKKGDIVSAAPIKPQSSITVALKVSKFANEEMKVGSQYGIYAGFNSGSCMVEELAPGKAKLKIDKEIQVETGDAILLGRNRQPRIFASGIIL